MTELVSRSHADVDTPNPAWRPRPGWAALLSLFAPLIGQLYNGRPRRALATVVVLQPWLVAGIAASLVAPGRVLRIALLALTMLAAVALVPWDAWRVARATAPTPRRWYQRWYVLVTVFAVSAFAIQPRIFDAVRRYVSEAYRIPAGGMVPTLLIGDHLLVSKWDNVPKARGDVVVFSDTSGRNYVQRVVGFPGDTIAMRAHTLRVNGSVVREAYAPESVSADPMDSEFEWQRAFLATDQDSATCQPTLGNWGPLLIPRSRGSFGGAGGRVAYPGRGT